MVSRQSRVSLHDQENWRRIRWDKHKQRQMGQPRLSQVCEVIVWGFWTQLTITKYMKCASFHKLGNVHPYCIPTNEGLFKYCTPFSRLSINVSIAKYKRVRVKGGPSFTQTLLELRLQIRGECCNRQFQLLVNACMQGTMGSKVSHCWKNKNGDRVNTD
jgi:hypothetical protein